ncbi:ALF repeat-containing protein, partial [Kitasatospora sp. NPDC056800]
MTALSLAMAVFGTTVAAAVPADPGPAPLPAGARTQVVEAWAAGGSAVKDAAAAALVGGDAQISDFLAAGLQRATTEDER